MLNNLVTHFQWILIIILIISRLDRLYGFLYLLLNNNISYS